MSSISTTLQGRLEALSICLILAIWCSLFIITLAKYAIDNVIHYSPITNLMGNLIILYLVGKNNIIH